MPEGTVSVHNYAELFAEIAKYPEDDVMLIGGGRLYTDLAKYCRRAYITLMDAETEGVDTFIPNFDNLDGWSLEAVSEPIEDGGYTFRFATYLNHNPQKYEE